MMWQYLVVEVIIFSAVLLTVVRMIGFFRTPASRCHGCSGCQLKELKKGR